MASLFTHPIYYNWFGLSYHIYSRYTIILRYYSMLRPSSLVGDIIYDFRSYSGMAKFWAINLGHKIGLYIRLWSRLFGYLRYRHAVSWLSSPIIGLLGYHSLPQNHLYTTCGQPSGIIIGLGPMLEHGQSNQDCGLYQEYLTPYYLYPVRPIHSVSRQYPTTILNFIQYFYYNLYSWYYV